MESESGGEPLAEPSLTLSRSERLAGFFLGGFFGVLVVLALGLKVASIFGIVSMVSAFAGLLMIVGGILLLYRGRITLAAGGAPEGTSNGERGGLSINFGGLSVGTREAGVAFFILGIAGICIPLYLLKPSDVVLIRVKGRIVDLDQGTKLQVTRSWPFNPPTSSGDFGDDVYTNIDAVRIEASAPGKFWDSTITIGESGITEKDLGIVRLKEAASLDEVVRDTASDSTWGTPPQDAERGYGGPQ